jgi:hypothetical protein
MGWPAWYSFSSIVGRRNSHDTYCTNVTKIQSPKFYIFKDTGIDSTESIPCDNQYRRGIDSQEGGGG